MSGRAGGDWVRELVERSRLPGEPLSRELPRWAVHLRDAVNGLPRALERPEIGLDEPLPFAPVWAGLAEHARAALASADARFDPRIDAAVADAALRHLRRELSCLGVHVLMRSFNRYRNGVASAPPRPGEDQLYRAFTAALARGGLIDALMRAPTLARLLGARLEGALRATDRFLEHWARDRVALARAFPGLAAAERLEVTFGLSDPHEGGRGVVRLRASGRASAGDAEPVTALYYKPRALAGQRLLDRALAIVHGRLGERPATRVMTVDCGDHGWAAHVERVPVDSVASWRAYHRNAGALLFALYLLGGTDAHADNIVARGARPVMIDTECLLHPRLRAEIAGAPERDDVTRTGLLPRWRRGEDGRRYSQAGLSDTRPFEPRRACWEPASLNSDAMTLRRGRERGNTGSNAAWPEPGGGPLDVRSDAVLEGFSRAYESLRSAPASAIEGLLADARVHRGRFVARPTSCYARFVERLSRPDPELTAGGEAPRDVLTRALSRSFAGARGSTRAAIERLVASELRQLMAGDIPLFYADASSEVVFGADGCELPGLLETSALAELERRVARLGPADLERQRARVREALAPVERGR